MKKKNKQKNPVDILITILSYGIALFLVIKVGINVFSSNKQNIEYIFNTTLKIFFIVGSLITMLILIIKAIKYLKER